MRTKRTSMHIIILLVSIITLVIQYICFSTINSTPALIVSFLTAFIFTHILLYVYKRYDSCFFYLFDTLLCEALVYASMHFNLIATLSLDKRILLWLSLICASIIITYSTLTYLCDKNSRFYNYKKFFIGISILFFILYATLFVYRFFLHCTDSFLTLADRKKFYMIPFYTIATHIEQYILDKTPIKSLLHYSFIVILLFVPMGFYAKIIFKNLYGVTKFIYTLGIPIIVEGLQHFLLVGRFNIDDIILGSFGILLGMLLFHILNSVFLLVKNEEFLFERRTNFYSNRISYWE